MHTYIHFTWHVLNRNRTAPEQGVSSRSPTALCSGARYFSDQPWGDHLLVLQQGIPGPWCRTAFYAHADMRCHVTIWVSAVLWVGILLPCLNVVLNRILRCFVLRRTNAHVKDLQRQVVACIFLLFAVFKFKKKIFSSSTLSRMWVSSWMKEK